MVSNDTMESMTGLSMAKKKKPTHRGRRSTGKGPAAHHADAKTHMTNASSAQDPNESRKHLFRALSSLKKASAGPIGDEPSSGVSDGAVG